MKHRQTRPWIMFFVVFVAMLSFAADQVPRAELVGTATYDFGSAKHGQIVSHTFSIRNNGSADLVIKSVDFTMPGMKAKFRRSILPGKEGLVTVEWDTSKVKGRLDAQAVLHCNDPAQPDIALTLQGAVRMPIEVKPFGAFFVSAYEGDMLEDSLSISVDDGAPSLELGDPQVQEGSHFRASLVPIVAGKEYQLTVHIAPDVPPGRYRESVLIGTNNPDMPRLRVPVNILIKGDVYVSVEAIDFGRIPLVQANSERGVMELLTQTVLVKKRSGTLRLLSITSDLNGLTIKQDPASGPSATHRVDIGLNPASLAAAGRMNGTVRIETDEESSRVILLPVTGEIF